MTGKDFFSKNSESQCEKDLKEWNWINTAMCDDVNKTCVAMISSNRIGKILQYTFLHVMSKTLVIFLNRKNLIRVAICPWPNFHRKFCQMKWWSIFDSKILKKKILENWR